MLRLILLLNLFFGAVACITVEDKDKNKPVSSTVVASAMRDQNFAWTLEPNSYRIEKTVAPGTNRVVRLHLQSQAQAVFEVSGSVLVDSNVIAGHSYRYRYLNTSGEVLFEEQLTVPKDFVVEGRKVLGADYSSLEYRRLFFMEDSVLVLQNFRLQLQVRELIVRLGAKLITFDRGTKAGPGQNGRSGGELQLQTNSAVGALKIEMRGENGGDGRKPAPPDRSRHGEYGINCGRLLAGNNGEAGGVGGNSGKFKILVLNKSSFAVEASIESARGGTGAQGSDFVQCSPGRSHKEFDIIGYPGIAAGDPGPNGLDGAKEASSLILGQHELVFN
jgi:hypothetical protein